MPKSASELEAQGEAVSSYKITHQCMWGVVDRKEGRSTANIDFKRYFYELWEKGRTLRSLHDDIS